MDILVPPRSLIPTFAGLYAHKFLGLPASCPKISTCRTVVWNRGIAGRHYLGSDEFEEQDERGRAEDALVGARRCVLDHDTVRKARQQGSVKGSGTGVDCCLACRRHHRDGLLPEAKLAFPRGRRADGEGAGEATARSRPPCRVGLGNAGVTIFNETNHTC
jgi:hypothetical protein